MSVKTRASPESIVRDIKRKTRRRALLNKAKRVIAIFAAMAFDKHLDYNLDENTIRRNRKEKE